MAAPYSQGGGGGRAGSPTDDSIILDKPYDLVGEPTAEKMQQLDEMLHNLYLAVRRTNTAITASGDVHGPSSSTDLHVVLFNGATGKIIEDSGQTISAIVASGFPVVYRTVSITELEVESLNSTPIEVVPAQGANTIICITSLYIEKFQTAAYGTAPNVQLRYQGIITDIVGAFSSTLTAATNTFFSRALTTGVFAGASSAVSNVPVEISLASNPTNPGTGVASMRVTVGYFVVSNTLF